MREMILNHASLVESDQCATDDWWKDIARGMAKLVDTGVVKASLRMCELDYPFHQIYQDMRKSGAHEEHRFLVRLSTKMPLLDDFLEEVKNRFLGCEAEALQPQKRGLLSPKEMDPFLLCALIDGVAIGLPSDPCWDSDSITVTFDELAPDTTIESISETIDNLSRSLHSDPIYARHQTQVRANASPQEIWKMRATIFPNLIFGPGVQDDLTALPKPFLSTVIGKLSALNKSAEMWRGVEDTMPQWTCKVTPENDSVISNPKLRNARLFASHDGTIQMFEWHARFGSGGRIHLRFEAKTKEVEIGYIGKHLPP